MFICDPCLEKNYKNSPSFIRSFGRCEYCEESCRCNDIPHRNLIPIKEPEKVIDTNKNVYIQRFTKEDGNPKVGGRYFTDLGHIIFHLEFKQWTKFSYRDDGDRIVEPEWWLEAVPESKYLEGILPHEMVDETFIEHHISYQHHGVVRMAVNKYKKFLIERLLDKTKDYER